jgi:FlaA1/EpsC-like NDP-sugar epimerase
MKENLFAEIINKILKKKILSFGYLPRWIIFSIDLFIVLVSSGITFFIINGLTVNFYNNLNISLRLAIIVFINALFFIIYKTYSGIIRHSTFIDGVKLLISTTSAYLSLIILNYLYFYLFNQKIYLTTSLFVDYVISFLFLFLFRIMIKYIFEIYSSILDSENKLLKTIIYGSDANAISVANALKTESPSRFKLVGFIDKLNQNNQSKRILDLPIFNKDKPINKILSTANANVLIITEKGLTQPEINSIVDECLEFGIKIYTVPIISDWDDDKQIANKIKSFNIEDLLARKSIVLDTNSISNQLNGKTILITGAAGSIGSEIARQVFLFEPKKIIILDQAETPLHELCLELKKIKSDIKIRNILLDIKDFDSLEMVFNTFKPNFVYHAAAYKHVPIIEENPIQAINTNILGTKNLADLSKKYNIERFVMVSTDKAVNPSNVMGASKRIAEKYVQSLNANKNLNLEINTKFITTRFGNVLGSNGSIVPLFTKQINEGGPITITHPEIIRYFMTIPEACQLVLEAGTMGKGGEIYIFDMGQPVKIIDLAHKMIKLAGFTPNKEIKIEIIGLRPGEKLYEELLNDSSKTLPTHNEKILIAQDITDDFELINKEILELETISRNFSNSEIVAKMKKIVPEFKSMNSIFENLDQD